MSIYTSFGQFKGALDLKITFKLYILKTFFFHPSKSLSLSWGFDEPLALIGIGTFCPKITSSTVNFSPVTANVAAMTCKKVKENTKTKKQRSEKIEKRKKFYWKNNKNESLFVSLLVTKYYYKYNSK